MTIDELVAKLTAAFPRGFGPAGGLEAWADIYRFALGKIDPQDLADSYRHTMATWIKSGPPKPGDFLAAAGGYSRPASKSKGPSRKQIEDEIFRLRPILIDSWWRDCSADIEAFLATFESLDVLAARGHLKIWVYNLASAAAQEQAIGRSMTVTLQPADWETIRRRVQSQRGSAQAKRLGGLKPFSAFLRDGPAAREIMPDG